jgi:hypothetical protein
MAATPGHWLLAASGHRWLSQASTHFQSQNSPGSRYSLCTDPTENTASVIVCVSLPAITWFGCCENVFTEPLPSSGRLSGSPIPAFSRHVIILVHRVRSLVFLQHADCAIHYHCRWISVSVTEKPKVSLQTNLGASYVSFIFVCW